MGRGLPLGYRIKEDHELKGRYRRRNGAQVARTIVEERIGMKLPPGAIIHHVDPNDKLTNRGPFVVCGSPEYHALLERRGRALRESGHADWRKCHYCGKWDDPKNMREMKPTERFPASRFYHHQYKARCVGADAPELKLKRERKTARHVRHLPEGIQGRKHRRPNPLWKQRRSGAARG